MLAVMSLSQHRVSSSKTVRPRAPCGARCIGHAVRTWSAVCSEAPYSQFGECGASEQTAEFLRQKPFVNLKVFCLRCISWVPNILLVVGKIFVCNLSWVTIGIVIKSDANSSCYEN